MHFRTQFSTMIFACTKFAPGSVPETEGSSYHSHSSHKIIIPFLHGPALEESLWSLLWKGIQYIPPTYPSAQTGSNADFNVSII